MRECNHLDLFPPGTKAISTTLPSGLRFRIYERGEGPVVLLLHGFPELALSWRFQLEGLGQKFRVVAPDLRGYGGTDAPSKTASYRLEHLCQDVVDLIEFVGVKRVHLVGHDWGGAIAWEFAQHHAQRLHTLAILNCPPAQILLRKVWRAEQLRRSWYIFFFQLPRLPEAIFRRDPDKLVRAVLRNTARNREPFTDEYLAPYADQIRFKGLPGLQYYRAALRSLRWRLRTIHVPTRLIWGLGDHALGPELCREEIYRNFVPHFDVVRIPEAGHWVQQEAPDRVNQLLIEHMSRAE